MSKLMWWYYGVLDAVSGGHVYHARWMSRFRIPPVPLWTVEWFFDLKDRCSVRWGRKDRCSDQGGRDDDVIPF